MDTPPERILRFFKTASTTGGLATRVAMEKYLNIEIDDDAYAEKLLSILGNMKGPLMKLAQFLATVPGALPEAYSEAFMQLQSNAPPMGIPFVKRRLKNELGDSWQSRFKNFDLNAAHAASLGQIHKATLQNGDDVAVKLQYPKMDQIIEDDLTQLKWLLSFYKTSNSAIKTDDIEKELRERLAEELDYKLEVKNLKLFSMIFQNQPNFIVPTVYDDLSTDRMITMRFHQGERILSYCGASDDVKNDLAKKLFYAWYYPLYVHNVIHGDPHPGNYLVTNDHKIVLLDFGCIRKFDTSFVDAVIMLYQALDTDDQDLAVEAYKKWGFEDLTKEKIEIITQWARLLYDPLLDDRARLIQDDIKGEKGWKTAVDVHAALNKAGGIKPPQTFVFMDRAAVGIGSVMMRLGVKLNWHQLFHELIALRQS